MISLLTLPIRLLGIVLMAAFMLEAMAPLRTFELNLTNINIEPETNVTAQTPAHFSNGLPLLPIGLSLVAVISIWMIYQTWQQHVGLANNELRNHRVSKKIRL